MTRYLQSAPIQIHFYPLLARVHQVSVDGDHITGTWEPAASKDEERMFKGGFSLRTGPQWLPQPGEIVRDFVNLRSEDIRNIAQFTQRYGPLEEAGSPGRQFRFSAARWREIQAELQRGWSAMAGPSVYWLETGLLAARWYDRHPRDAQRVDYLERQMYWGTVLLRDYLHCDLWLSLPYERFKLCVWPDCRRRRYFIAYRDLRQKYCSETCAHEADKKTKRESIAHVREKARQHQHAQQKTARKGKSRTSGRR